MQLFAEEYCHVAYFLSLYIYLYILSKSTGKFFEEGEIHPAGL